MAHPLFDTRESHYPASVPTPEKPAVAPAPETLTIGRAPERTPHKKHPLVITGLVLALIIFTIILANFAIISIAAPSGEPTSPAPAQAQEQASPPLAALPPADPSVGPPALPPGLPTTIGEGKFLVGTDIAAGTYQTSGPSGGFDCYWERLKDINGTASSIIANNLGPGPATVTIAASDAAFQTRWCNTWTKVS